MRKEEKVSSTKESSGFKGMLRRHCAAAAALVSSFCMEVMFVCVHACLTQRDPCLTRRDPRCPRRVTIVHRQLSLMRLNCAISNREHLLPQHAAEVDSYHCATSAGSVILIVAEWPSKISASAVDIVFVTINNNARTHYDKAHIVFSRHYKNNKPDWNQHAYISIMKSSMKQQWFKPSFLLLQLFSYFLVTNIPFRSRWFCLIKYLNNYNKTVLTVEHRFKV